MNTPTHLIFAAAAFAKPDQPKVTTAALIGGFIPDFSLYFMFVWHRFVLGTETTTIFRDLYYSDYWQFIFALDNSFIVWAGLLIGALALRSPLMVALSGAAFLHLMFDFPLHHDDARAHFWPATMWKFESPFSYWDDNHYGNWVAPVEAALALILSIVLWVRFDRLWPRILIALGALATTAPYVIFVVIMGFGSDIVN